MTAPEIASGKLSAFVDWCKTHLGRGEFATLDSREIQRMASELNMGADDLIALSASKVSDLPLMRRMMELHGINVDEVEKHMAGVMRDMEVACARCGDRKMCKHDLDTGADTDQTDQYCPNAETMQALARM